MFERVLEAEMGKISAEADKGSLEKELQVVQTKLAAAEDRLRDAEMHKRNAGTREHATLCKQYRAAFSVEDIQGERAETEGGVGCSRGQGSYFAR